MSSNSRNKLPGRVAAFALCAGVTFLQATVVRATDESHVYSQADGGSTITCNAGRVASRLAAAQYPLRDDRVETYQLGPLKITATPVVTLTEIEKGTNLYFSFENSSAIEAQVNLPNWRAIHDGRPDWIYHLWPIIDEELSADGSFTVKVPANSKTTLKLYMSNEAQPGGSKTMLNFRFLLVGTNTTLEIPLLLKSAVGEYGPDGLRVPISAQLTGRVLDVRGKPVQGATVAAFLGNGLWRRQVTTGAQGKFTLSLVSDEGLSKFTGGRLTKPKAEWHLTVTKSGQRLASMTSLRVKNGVVRTCNVKLVPMSTAAYSMTADVTFDNPYGFWDMELFGSGDRVVATQGWHPTESIMVTPVARPGNIVALDLTGRVLWRVPVGDFCWRLAVNPRGDLIAANCADGYLRVINSDGTVVQKIQVVVAGNYNSAAGLAFSPDGTKLFAGGQLPAPAVFDTRTWKQLWTVPGEIYMAMWSDTSSELVIASMNGVVSSYTASGELRWRRGIGGVPLFINVDSQGRVVVNGKSHTSYAWDSHGNPLWVFETSNTSNRTRYARGASTSGDYIFVAGQQGLVQALNGEGKLLWQRFLPESVERGPSGQLQSRVHNPGHGGTYVAPDGSFVAVGARMNQVLVFAPDGSVIWESTQYPARRADYDETKAYHPNANAVTATPDGRVIIAGYSDSTIRIFTRKG